MNRNDLITKIIKFLIKLKREEKDIGKRHPVKMPKPISPIFSVKKILIIIAIIFSSFYILRAIYVSTVFSTVMEGLENVGASVGLLDEHKTLGYKRKQEALIKIKKETEEKEALEKVKRAKEHVIALKQNYISKQVEYEKYVDQHGNYLEGVEVSSDIEKVIDDYRTMQKDFIPILEECEYIIEHDVQTHIKKAERNQKDLKEIKYKIGELALKGQKGLNEEEMKELDKLVDKVKSMSNLKLTDTRAKILFHYFKYNQPYLYKSEIPGLNNCPCEFIVTEIWEELRKDKYFLKNISLLRLHINMQEYSHIIWKTSIMEDYD